MNIALLLVLAQAYPSNRSPAPGHGDLPPIRALAPSPGEQCEWTFRMQEEFEEVELESRLDERHEGPRPPPAPRSTRKSTETKISDRFHSRAGGRVDRIERNVERARGALEVTTRGAEGTQVAESTWVAELDGTSFELERLADGGWKWEPTQEGRALALDPDNLVVDLSLPDLAPEDPHASTWIVPPDILGRLFRPGGDIGWHVEGDPLYRPGDAAALVDYAGEVRAARAPAREGDPQGTIFLELAVEVVATEDLRESQHRRAERHAETTGGKPETPLVLLETRTYRGAGTAIWDPRLGRAIQVDLALDVEVLWQREFTVTWPDRTRTYSLALRSEGKTELSLRHTSSR